MDRTAAALTSTLGTPPFDVHPHASGARQGVLQVGSVSLELIEQPNLDQSASARIVGMVLLIDDFDTALEAFGPQRLGAVRTTANGSQRSVTLRPELNLGLGIALKSKPLTD
jgi:hypothetical protein